MNLETLTAWLRQPTTLNAAAILVAAIVYWFVGDGYVAGLAAALLLGVVPDDTKTIIGKIEALEDSARPKASVVKLPTYWPGVVLLSAGLGLTACSAAQDAKVVAAEAVAVHDGQLFCAVATTGGPVVVGLVNAVVGAAAPTASPAVVLATGATTTFVNAACKAIGGIPVVPPANPAVAPQVAIVPPAA